MSEYLYQEGIYAIAFSYPVVPKEQARIRFQISAAHEKAQIEKCVAAVIAANKAL